MKLNQVGQGMKLIRNECVAAILLLSILELTQSAEPKIALVNLGKNLNLELVLIPSGKFTMGSPEDEKGRSNNETLHEVTLSKSFYLGKYEVTQEQWEALMGNNPSTNKGAKLPVTDVTWNDCQEFIKKLNANTKGGYR
jgi:formylglycine-generating enzyme required for sulfatase activity